MMLGTVEGDERREKTKRKRRWIKTEEKAEVIYIKKKRTQDGQREKSKSTIGRQTYMWYIEVNAQSNGCP